MEPKLTISARCKARRKSAPHSSTVLHTTMKRAIVLVGYIFAISLALASESAANRPATWAQPVTLEGVPNLYMVSADLYRSAQPTAQGMENLKQMGIETVINLRAYRSDRDEIGTTRLGHEHIRMKVWLLKRKDAVRFLKIVTDPKRTPVLVHCLHGADRTGTMCALYRIAVQGWTKEEAIQEMTDGGFGFHEIYVNLPEWIRRLDIGSIKKDAGI
jgi:protein tyrosine phosphatase (PTP) superfamily phosphohydrolase (DUF442 family)